MLYVCSEELSVDTTYRSDIAGFHANAVHEHKCRTAGILTIFEIASPYLALFNMVLHRLFVLVRSRTIPANINSLLILPCRKYKT